MIVAPESTPATVKNKSKSKSTTSSGNTFAPHKLTVTLADFTLGLLDVEEGLPRGRLFQSGIPENKRIEHLVQSFTKVSNPPSNSNPSGGVSTNTSSEQTNCKGSEGSTVHCLCLEGSSHGISAATIDATCQLLSFADPHDHSLYLSRFSFQIPLLSDEEPSESVSDMLVDEEISDKCTSSTQSKDEYAFQMQPYTLIGHSPGVIFDLAFIPNNDTSNCINVIGTCEDGNIYGWSIDPETDDSTSEDSADYKVNRVTYSGGHIFPIWCCDVSPLSLYFATGSADTTVKLWDFNRKFPLRMFAGHSLDVDVIKFHPNCKYLASGSSDRSVRLWSISDGRNVRLFPGHTAHITGLAFTSDGQQLISSEANVIRVWDMKMCRQQREIKLNAKEKITSLILHNSLCIVTCASGAVKFYDFTKGTLNYQCQLDSLFMLGSRVASKMNSLPSVGNATASNSNSKSSTFVNNSLFVYGYKKPQ